MGLFKRSEPPSTLLEEHIQMVHDLRARVGALEDEVSDALDRIERKRRQVQALTQKLGHSDNGTAPETPAPEARPQTQMDLAMEARRRGLA